MLRHVVCSVILQNIGIIFYQTERISDFVRQSGRKLTDRSHFVFLTELPLGKIAFGTVLNPNQPCSFFRVQHTDGNRILPMPVGVVRRIRVGRIEPV